MEDLMTTFVPFARKYNGNWPFRQIPAWPLPFPKSPFLSAPKRLNNRVHDSFPVGPDHRSDDHTNYRPGFPRCLIKLREGPGFWRLNSASATEFSSASRR